MRKHKDIIALICAIVISVVAAFLLQPDGIPDTTPQPPVPEEIVLNDYVVKVVTRGPKLSRVGVGVLVNHAGTTFVLTSRMIFTGVDVNAVVTVTHQGVKYTAAIIDHCHSLGLVALSVEGGPFDSLEIDDAPNLPPYIYTEVYGVDTVYTVVIKHYLANPDWMLLDGAVPGTFTGAPIIQGGRLAGLVIGVSTANPDEAFAVGNHAIRVMAEVVASGDEVAE